MEGVKTKSLERIERTMESVEEGSMRHRVLDSAKKFKTSWVELGQALYAAWKDKLYKDWGYLTFEAYTSREIGIKKVTAMKLLKSYYFLEKEEPAYLQKDYTEQSSPAVIPSYESVNVLRLAKGKPTLGDDDYANLKRDVFVSGKNACDVKKDLTSIIRQREELEPDEARKRRRSAAIKRLISALKTLRTDIEVSRMLPAAIVKDVSSLISKLEREVES